MSDDSSTTDQDQTANVASTPKGNGKAAKAKLSLSNLPDLLTVGEVAEVLRVSPLTIKRWGKKGKLPFIRINSRGDRRYKKEVVFAALGMEAR